MVCSSTNDTGQATVGNCTNTVLTLCKKCKAHEDYSDSFCLTQKIETIFPLTTYILISHVSSITILG